MINIPEELNKCSFFPIVQERFQPVKILCIYKLTLWKNIKVAWHDEDLRENIFSIMISLGRLLGYVIYAGKISLRIPTY